MQGGQPPFVVTDLVGAGGPAGKYRKRRGQTCRGASSQPAGVPRWPSASLTAARHMAPAERVALANHPGIVT